jgi:class 3 adenylate cyclase/tetratricopeptide (TPR) repeat protein
VDGSSTLCAACGTANREGARFCDSCGTSLAVGGDRAAEARKIVTVLFADLVGSTAFEENLDPEGVRRVVGQLHDLLRRAVVGQGGRVVKTTGDGLMAVFGVPLVREDDAERAVRAAAAMQADFARFAAPLDTRLGSGALGLRVGVNTGEVVVSAVDDDIIGDPVNTAARLEQAAAPGTVLVGPGTERLVRGRVVLEAVAPLALKGKQDAVDAWRVPAALTEPTGDREAPVGLVGRERELAQLHDAFERVRTDRTAHLVTVIGSPGVGKSRLVTESMTGLAERARLLRVQGRPEGGTGLTPIADGLRAFLDVPRGASTDEVRSRLPAELRADEGDGDRVLALVRALLDGDPIGAMEETSWAVRRVLEAMAREAPIVVVLDDLHWTEAVVLDLVEHLARWLRDAPVLLVSVTRPELAERRAGLTAAPHTVIRLAGLAPDSCRRLAHELLQADDLPDAVVERALRASEGNPLFLREVLRMLVDDGVLRRAGDRWTLTVDASGVEVPPTINALLAARIDQLTTDERVVLERAAVIGRSFTTDVLASLLPPQLPDVDEVLRRLCGREMLDSVLDAGTAGEYRFHHALIRDAAYGRLLKEVRTELHERLGEQVAAAGDDELAGWHLEQAVGYRREVGLGEESVIGALAARAGEYLGRAGRRSLGADDPGSAAALLGRAVAALRSAGAERTTLLLDRGDALLSLGDLTAADDVLDELSALTGDDPLLRAGADTLVAQLNALRSPGSLTGAAERAGRAASVLLAAGDDRGAARAEGVHAQVLAALGRFGACEAALDRALAAARRVGDQRRANAVLALAPVAALWGPSPVARASGRCLDVIRVLRITRGAPHVEAHALRCQAGLEAMRDRPDAAQRMLAIARSTFEDLGDRVGLLENSSTSALVALYAGDLPQAEERAREALAGYEAMGARTQMLTATSLLARTLLEAGRVDEAAAVVAVADPGEDVPASITLASVRAQVLAESGELAQAEAAARAGVELAAATDALVHQAFAHLGMARVLARAGRASEAVDHARRARDLCAAKGSVVGERTAVAIAGARTVGPAVVGSGRPSTSRRPPLNLATASLERLGAALNRGEDADPDWYAPGFELVDHVRHLTLDAASVIASHHMTGRRTSGTRWRIDVLATLGDRHAMLREVVSWDAVTAYADSGTPMEYAEIGVSSTDADGRTEHHDTFGPDDLGGAFVALLERRAGDLEGRAREAALRRCELAGALGGTGDARLEEILALDDRCWIVRIGAHGAVSLEEIVASTVALYVTDADGNLERMEAFDDDAAALAAFDELVGSDWDRSGAPAVSSNLATRAEQRWVDTFNRGEPLAPDRFADGYRCFDHRYQEVFDVAAMTRNRQLLSRAVVECRVTHRPIAVLGRRHALAGHEIRSVGLVGLDDGSTSEIDSWRVTTVDHAGRLERNDVFPVDDLHLAVAALYEARAGDGEVAGAAAALRRRARLIRTFGRLGEDPDDAFWTDVRPDVALVVSGSSGVTVAETGREPLQRLVGAFGAGTDRRVLDVVAQLGEHDLLVRVAFTPVVAGTAVTADQLILFRTDLGDGRLAAVEIFLDHDAESLALRRVAELEGREEPPPARRPPRPNLASAAHAACNACINLGRVHDVELFAPEFETFHHPTQMRADLVELHRSQRLGLRTLLDMEVDDTLLASLGDRHAVLASTMRHRGVRGLNEGSASNRLDHLVVSTGPDGLIHNVEVFGEDQCHLALAELWARHAEDLAGPEREAALRRSKLFGLLGAQRDDDWYAAVAAHLDPSYESVSHVPAPASVGVGSGREQLVGWSAAQQVLPNRPDRIRDVLAHDERGLAVVVLDRAVDLDGEVVDHEVVAVYETGGDGRVRRVEGGFATVEAALDRYDELVAAREVPSQ